MPVLGNVVNPASRIGWGRDRPYQSGRATPRVTTTVSAAGGGCAAVLVAVEWGTGPGVTTITLSRVTPDGVATVVRGSPATLSGGWALFWDLEAPLNTTVTYVASSTQTAVTATSDPVTATVTGFGCLSDPLAPGNDVPLAPFGTTPPGCTDETGVAFVSLGDESYESAGGVFDIIGARRPRTVTQVRRDLTSTLQLISKTLADRAALNTLFGTGHDLLLRLSTVDYGWATDTYAAGYISVGTVVSTRIGSPDMTRSRRLWKIPITVVDAPENVASTLTGSNGVAGPGATWGDLLALGLTWGDLLNLGLTWADLIRGLP